MGLKEKVKDVGKRLILKAVIFAVKRINTEIAVKELQEKYKGTKQKTIRVIIPNKDMILNFRVEEGKLKYIKKPEEIDIKAVLDSNTFLSLLAGKQKVIDPATGEERTEEYSPYDAYLHGDLQVFGEGTTNDVYLAFRQVWGEIKGQVRNVIGQKIFDVIR